MPQNAPPFKTDRSADKGRCFINPGATNLQAVSGLPAFGPQRCTIIATAAAGAMTLTTEDNQALTYTGLAAGIPVEVPVPVKAVVSSTTANLYAFWQVSPAKEDPQYGIFPPNA